MTWECDECHAAESGGTRINAVCHHCGKTLCREDQVVIMDHVFATGHGDGGTEAVHCRDCKSRYHLPGDLPLGARSR